MCLFFEIADGSDRSFVVCRTSCQNGGSKKASEGSTSEGSSINYVKRYTFLKREAV